MELPDCKTRTPDDSARHYLAKPVWSVAEKNPKENMCNILCLMKGMEFCRQHSKNQVIGGESWQRVSLPNLNTYCHRTTNTAYESASLLVLGLYNYWWIFNSGFSSFETKWYFIVLPQHPNWRSSTFLLCDKAIYIVFGTVNKVGCFS